MSGNHTLKELGKRVWFQALLVTPVMAYFGWLYFTGRGNLAGFVFAIVAFSALAAWNLRNARRSQPAEDPDSG